MDTSYTSKPQTDCIFWQVSTSWLDFWLFGYYTCLKGNVEDVENHSTVSYIRRYFSTEIFLNNMSFHWVCKLGINVAEIPQTMLWFYTLKTNCRHRKGAEHLMVNVWPGYFLTNRADFKISVTDITVRLKNFILGRQCRGAEMQLSLGN